MCTNTNTNTTNTANTNMNTNMNTTNMKTTYMNTIYMNTCTYIVLCDNDDDIRIGSDFHPPPAVVHLQS